MIMQMTAWDLMGTIHCNVVCHVEEPDTELYWTHVASATLDGDGLDLEDGRDVLWAIASRLVVDLSRRNDEL